MPSSSEEQLPRVVVLAGKAIREYFEGALAEAGASLATWVVLYGVERGGWDNQRDLARDLRIEGATLTRHLDRMERDGLIVRTRDPDDRRQMRVDLTAEGHEVFRRLKSVAQRTSKRAMTGVSADDRAHLRRILDRVRANVGGDRADERSA
jgi:MarR family transcriptional regulator for hemolysin